MCKPGQRRSQHVAASRFGTGCEYASRWYQNWCGYVYVSLCTEGQNLLKPSQKIVMDVDFCSKGCHRLSVSENDDTCKLEDASTDHLCNLTEPYLQVHNQQNTWIATILGRHMYKKDF